MHAVFAFHIKPIREFSNTLAVPLLCSHNPLLKKGPFHECLLPG